MRVSPKLLCILVVTILSITFPLVSAFADEYCFEEAGMLYQVSPDLLRAISKVESDHNPLAVNFNKNGTYDFGHMQINSRWYPVVGDSLWNSLGDPCQSTKVGAWILAQCIRRQGYTWQSIGCYNAGNELKKIRYAWKIYRTLAKEQANFERKRQKKVERMVDKKDMKTVVKTGKDRDSPLNRFRSPVTPQRQEP